MPKKSQAPARETGFFCSAEWHLAPLHPFCALLYPFALRISKKSKRFAASAPAIAEHFGRSVDTVLRATAELRDSGLFVPVSKPLGEPVVYEPIKHADWTVSHPGMCCAKTEPFWAGEGDPLAQQLYAASGCQVRFFANEVRCLRKLNIPEDALLQSWQVYWDAESQRCHASRWKKNRRGVKGRFLRLVKEGNLVAA